MRYELIPTNGRKSFYGKAIVVEEDGSLTRHYDGYTATTGTHIISFCGLKKADFLKMEVKPL